MNKSMVYGGLNVNLASEIRPEFFISSHSIRLVNNNNSITCVNCVNGTNWQILCIFPISFAPYFFAANGFWSGRREKKEYGETSSP